MIFTDFLLKLLEDSYTQRSMGYSLLGTLLGVQDFKKLKLPGRDNSSLAFNGSINKNLIKINLNKIDINTFLKEDPERSSLDRIGLAWFDCQSENPYFNSQQGRPNDEVSLAPSV